MIKSRSIFIAILTFTVGSLFAYLFYLKPQKFIQEKAGVETSSPIFHKTNTEKSKTFDQNGEEIFWEGTSEGFKIRWTNKDIYIDKNGKTQKLFSKYAKTYYDLNFKFEQEYSKKLDKYIKTNKLNSSCDISIDGRINSIVGEYLTLEVEEFYMCGIIQYETHLVVFDLKNLNKIEFIPDEDNLDSYAIGRGMNITDLFEDKDVLSAFLDNSKVKESIDNTESNFQQKSTLNFLKSFAKKEKYPNLTERALTGFTINRIENEKVIVKVALYSYSKQHGLDYLELKLNMPENLKNKIEKADSREEGFLEKDRIDDSTEIYFKAKKK